MKKRYALTGLLACVMAAGSLVGCDRGESYDYTIKVWAATNVKEVTQAQADAYVKTLLAETGSDKKIKVDVQAVGEGDAASNMIQDVEAGADVFCFAQDQLSRLYQSKALQPLSTKVAETVLANNDDTSIAASKVGDKLVAYPLTSDNGYFMYYDSRVLSAEDVKNMDTIVAKCKANSKKVYMELDTSAWYMMSYFFAYGCESTFETNDKGEFVSYHDTLNSAEGIRACGAMYKLLKEDTVHVSGSGCAEAFGSGAAVCVSGTWDSADAKKALGEYFAVAELPYVTDGQGEAVHLGSFSGCKLMGVKPQEDPEKLGICQKLAEYLSGEECQLKRFKDFGWGPSNKAAQATDEVKADEVLQALNAQNKYATVQGNYPGDWWTGAKAIASGIKTLTEFTTKGAQTVLRTYNAAIDGYLTANS